MEKNHAEIRDEIIRDYKESMKKWDDAKQVQISPEAKGSHRSGEICNQFGASMIGSIETCVDDYEDEEE